MIKKEDVIRVISDITIPTTKHTIGEQPNVILNVNAVDKTLFVDVSFGSPALNIKEEFKQKLVERLSNAFEVDKVSIHFRPPLKPKEAPNTPIKGKPIEGIKNIIAIASGKGGVGKSTIAANIAVSLQQMGFGVGLVDADIYGPSVPILFDCEEEKPLSVEVDGKSKIKPIENYGIKLVSIGFFTRANEAVVWRGPMATKALTQMIHDTHWGELDFLLIDLPPGTSDIHLSMVQSVPVTGAVIVSTPQDIALADVRRGVSMFRSSSIDVPVLGAIENMSYFVPEDMPDKMYFIFGQNGVKKMAEKVEIPFLGELPLSTTIRQSADVGYPISLKSETIEAKAYKNLVQNMVYEVGERNTHLPPTEIVRITTMAGCSAKK